MSEAKATPPREELLLEAAALITGDRNHAYGSPTQNFTNTAAIWTTLLGPKLAPGAALNPSDVSMLMIALKLARMTAQPKRDNWADIAGYAGCGYEADVDSGRIPAETSSEPPAAAVFPWRTGRDDSQSVVAWQDDPNIARGPR